MRRSGKASAFAPGYAALAVAAALAAFWSSARAASPPNPPGTLTATRGQASVALTWSAPKGGAAVHHYDIFQRAGGAPEFNRVASTAGPETAFTVAGLTNGRLYDFHVVAVNEDGASRPSNVATATPLGLPGSPTAVTARAGYPEATVTTFAGAVAPCSESPKDDGTGIAARFCSPKSGAFDGAGNYYVSDHRSGRVRKISPDGVTTTLPPKLSGPSGVTADNAGNVYVSDTETCVIRKITPQGAVSIVVGVEKECFEIDGPVATARADGPTGLTMDPSGVLYVTSYNGCSLRKLTPDGVLTTIAGKHKDCRERDGIGTEARFEHPAGIVRDSQGNLFIVDEACTLRKVTPDGSVSTVAGVAGACSAVDGVGAKARFMVPTYVGIDSAGALYVTDHGAHALRRVTPDGVVTTVAGMPGTSGTADGVGHGARLFHPNGVAVSSTGVIYVTDRWNNLIRKAVMNSVPSVVVTFSPPTETGGAAITGYMVRSVPPDGVDGDFGTLSLSHVVSGLKPGVAYTFTVMAINAAGRSLPSPPSNSVTVTPQ